MTIRITTTKPDTIHAIFTLPGFTLAPVDMARIAAMPATGYAVVAKGKVAIAPAWD